MPRLIDAIEDRERSYEDRVWNLMTDCPAGCIRCSRCDEIDMVEKMIPSDPTPYAMPVCRTCMND